MKILVDRYLKDLPILNVIDVGSYDVNGSYKNLFSRQGWSYIGVDIESPNSDRDLLSLATRFFSENEVSQLKLCPLDAQKDLFYQFWTLKESMIKCLGSTLFLGLQRAQFNISENKISLDNNFKDHPEDHFFQFKHFKDTDYFSIALTSFANS